MKSKKYQGDARCSPLATLICMLGLVTACRKPDKTLIVEPDCLAFAARAAPQGSEGYIAEPMDCAQSLCRYPADAIVVQVPRSVRFNHVVYFNSSPYEVQVIYEGEPEPEAVTAALRREVMSPERFSCKDPLTFSQLESVSLMATDDVVNTITQNGLPQDVLNNEIKRQLPTHLGFHVTGELAVTSWLREAL